jgi:septum formation inhibitor-activating ATPase MinD
VLLLVLKNLLPLFLTFNGKGSIGKSTTTSKISTALVEAGYKVLQLITLIVS